MEELFSSESIQRRLREVAVALDSRYGRDGVDLILIMKGALCLASDLMRVMLSPIRLDFISCKSYGMAGAQRQELLIEGLENLDLHSRDVLVVDDIFDSGETMKNVVKAIQGLDPKSVASLVLLTKLVDRKTSYRPDYSLFDVEDRFVVGYGLDFKERYRNLPGIFALDSAL